MQSHLVHDSTSTTQPGDPDHLGLDRRHAYLDLPLTLALKTAVPGATS